MPGAAVNEAEARLGYFGKIPSRGDFINRGLPGAFIEAWDRWLQRAITQARADLGSGWIASYRISPPWRFVLQAGVCGDQAAAGVMLPSIDRVGRHYPFVVAAIIAGPLGAGGLAEGSEGWFNVLEVSAAAVLDQILDPERLAERLAALGPVPLVETVARRQRSDLWARLPEGVGLRSPLSHFGAIAETWPWMPEGTSQWWTSGSAIVEPSVLLCRGLPEPAGFAAFWNGEWQKAGWRDTAVAGRTARRRAWPLRWLPPRSGAP